MNFKSLLILVILGLALGCTFGMFAKKHNKVTFVPASSAAQAVETVVAAQPEVDIAYLTTDLYELGAQEAVKYPELDYSTQLPVITEGLEKADKAIFKAVDAFKNGLNTVISTVKQPVVYKSALVTSIIALPVIVALYVNNAEKYLSWSFPEESPEKLNAKQTKLENQTLASAVKKAKKALLF